MPEKKEKNVKVSSTTVQSQKKLIADTKINTPIQPEQKNTSENGYTAYYPENTSQAQRDYLFKFMLSFNEENLAKLCSHLKAWQFLIGIKFQPPGKGYQTCLMNELISNEKYSDTFFNYLCKESTSGLPLILAMLPRKLAHCVLRESYQDGQNYDIHGIDILMSAVYGAIKFQHLAFIKYMLDRKEVDWSEITYCDNNILQYASLYSSEDIVEEILSRNMIDVNGSGKLKPYETPLYLAAQNGMLENVVQLVSAGANIDGNDKNYIRTPLLVAIMGSHPEVVKAITVCEAKLPAALTNMSIAEIEDYRKNHHDFMSYLERKLEDSKKFPIEYNAGEYDGVTTEYVKHFFNHYNEKNIAELLGKPTALHILFCNQIEIEDEDYESQSFMKKILNNPERALFFYDYLCKKGSGGELNYMDLLPVDMEQIVLMQHHQEGKEVQLVYGWYFYQYLIYFAITRGHGQFVKEVLECGKFDPNLPRNQWIRSNILHIAAKNNYHEIVYIILKNARVDIDAIDESGNTALHYAAILGNDTMISLLLLAGANINGNVVDIMSTPLMSAFAYGHLKSVSLLKECGGKYPDEINDESQSLFPCTPQFPITNDVKKIRLEKLNYLTGFLQAFGEMELGVFFQQEQAWSYLFFDLPTPTGETMAMLAQITLFPQQAGVFYDYLCRRDSQGVANIFKLLPENLNDAVMINQARDAEQITGILIVSICIKSAMMINHYQFLKLILDSGKLDALGILQFAAMKQRSHQICLFKNYIRDIDESPAERPYETALYLAALSGKEVLPLLMAGANVDGKDKHYIRTPILAAMHGKHYQTVKILMLYGAKLPKMLVVEDFSELMDKCENHEDIMGHFEKVNLWYSKLNTAQTFFEQPTLDFHPLVEEMKRGVYARK